MFFFVSCERQAGVNAQNGAMRASPPTDAAFARFSAQLYCSGAEEQQCALPSGVRAPSGRCHWWRRTADDDGFVPLWEGSGANSSAAPLHDGNSVGQHDRWMPADAPGYRRMGANESRQCVRGKRLLLVGDSTTRDTFHALLAAAGRPIWRELELRRHPWIGSAWAPPAPFTTRAVDKYGVCGGDQTATPPRACVRDVAFDETGELLPLNGSSARKVRAAARVSYQYVMSNASWEMELLRGLMRQRGAHLEYDAALVQCPVWTSFMPRAYDGAAPTRAARHTIERHERYDNVGEHCRDIVATIRAHSPRARVLMLGLSALPQGSRTFKGIHQDEPKLFASMHAGLGLACERSGGEDGVEYTIRSRDGVVPLDRYNLWKGRRRDSIHAYFNAQFALVELIFNHLCGETAKRTKVQTKHSHPFYQW